jgi:type IV pilus assembly protein PilO
MDRISGRLALLVAVVLVLVVVLAAWFAVLSPQRSKAAALDTQIGDANVRLASTEALLSSPTARQSTVQLAQLRRALPDDTEMSEIIRELSRAASKTGVRVDSITPSTPVAAAGAQALPITLSVSGRYFRIANFMHELRTRAKVEDGNVRVKGRLFAVDNVAFAKSPTKGLLSATLALDAFMAGAAPAQPSTAVGAQTTTTTP